MATATALQSNAFATSADEFSTDEIAARAAALREKVAVAAQRSGRGADAVSIVCVTKMHPAPVVLSAYAAGLRDFGENYVQEAMAKQDELAADSSAATLKGARWHLIGHLQSNKTNGVAGRFALIETVDSLKLGQRIARSAESLGAPQEILIQVKLGDEDTKSGIAPDDALRLAEALQQTPGINLRGLMAIAPLNSDGTQIADPRPYFAQAKRLFDALPEGCRQILSMGMSADYECAIEEGSTCIRVGTTLLGSRRPSAA